ncbi:hypothetical protein ANCCAN_29246 [Ancylostoma caninum]|uniref:Uncharacterized protein n=1 Tax=Ancylostoma caninum TaxID=29170 RepID=A0A368EYZ4_ANCCA|nr:hypothetical protein ANCCAN_29246 [Ancylostoma caninum]
MGCFLENLYSLMGTIQLSIDRGHTLELTHFAPQTWYCNFKENLDNYIIIRYEEHENRTKKYSDDTEEPCTQRQAVKAGSGLKEL